MDRSLTAVAALLFLCAALYGSLPGQAQEVPTVRRVQVLGNQNPLEIEIEGSDRLVPQVQVITHPDRLVVDFANAVPAAQLRNQKLNRAELKSVRTSLFSSKPPVTRVVLDLNGPQAYQVFPSGRTVIIKLGGDGPETARLVTSSPDATSAARLVTSSYRIQSVQITPPEPPPLVVSFEGGLLSITANRASLSEVLYAVHQRTGADIAIPAGAEQEKVVAQIGPASAPEVLSRLLNGSKFNFLILSSATDPSTLDRVILSTRPEGPAPAYRPAPQARVDDDADADAASRMPPPPPPPSTPSATPGQAPGSAPETRAPQSNDVPD
jgi:hypothetical protein